MSDKRNHRRISSTKAWLIIGVIVLIVLLIMWLTMADLFGDTDVAALLTPVSLPNFLLP